MYHDVMVALDNSECSNRAVEVAIDLARRTGARLTGNHVYAARLHDTRFRQLEPGLPDRYQTEEILQRQRDIHDDLIGRGLGIISDSYLDAFEEECRGAGVESKRKSPEGRNYVELVRDARESRYDLVVVGAHGLGRVERSVLGSVCERVARLVECDVLVVREGRSPDPDGVLVAMDGSDCSFGALQVGLQLARLYGVPAAAVAAYDPHFHGAAFKSIAGVLSDEAARLFRFKEQEALHDEVIDQGLMRVYRSHLIEAQRMATRLDLPLAIEVLEGKPFDAVASHVQATHPSLLVAGRSGIHRSNGTSLGSTAENLLRFATCNVLLTNRSGENERRASSEAETAASIEVRWSLEAKQRLERVPVFVRSMARKRIEGFAREHGRAEITLDLYQQAREHFGM